MLMLRMALRTMLSGGLRSLLTIGSVAVCVFVFSLLLSLDEGVSAMLERSSDEGVLIVFEKYKACPPYSRLPVSYAAQIAGIEGVSAVTPVRFLLSDCGTTTNLIAVHGIEPDQFRTFRALDVDDSAWQAFEAEKGGAMVGRKAAEKYGWQAGQTVTLAELRGVSFTVLGIFGSGGSSLDEVVLVDREYLEQSINEIGEVTMFLAKVGDGADGGAVADRIDSNFANYATMTSSTPEKGFMAQQISGFSELVAFAQLIAWVSLGLLMLATANSVSMGLRDRMREVAQLKLLGFDSRLAAQLIVMESLLTGILASLLGVALGIAVLGNGMASISVEGYTMYPQFTVATALASFVAGVGMCLAGGYVPAQRGATRPIGLALRGVD
ncbi:ABC transporter permease [bacterium]|nr:ABC transporter permease [bacterium]